MYQCWVLSSTLPRVTSPLNCHQPTHNGNQSHQNGEHNGWQETSDDTQDLAWNIVDETQEGDLVSQVVDVTDGTDDCNRNRPEQNHQNDEGGSSNLPQHPLRLADLEVLPDDLIRSCRDSTRIHLRFLLGGHSSVSSLGSLLGVELDEDRWEKLSIEFLLSHLPLLNFRDKSSELASGPFDGIDFLSDQGDLSSAVFWAILVLHKSRPSRPDSACAPSDEGAASFLLSFFFSHFSRLLFASWLNLISAVSSFNASLSRSSTLSVKSLQSVASHDLFIAPPKRDANFCWFRYSSGTSVKRTVREDIRAALKGARRYV